MPGKALISYKAMAAAMGITINSDGTVGDVTPANVIYPIAAGTEPNKTGADTTLATAFSDIYAKQAKLAEVTKGLVGKTPDEIKKDTGWIAASNALNTSRGTLASDISTNQQAHADWTKWATMSLKDWK